MCSCPKAATVWKHSIIGNWKSFPKPGGRTGPPLLLHLMPPTFKKVLLMSISVCLCFLEMLAQRLAAIAPQTKKNFKLLDLVTVRANCAPTFYKSLLFSHIRIIRRQIKFSQKVLLLESQILTSLIFVSYQMLTSLVFSKSCGDYLFSSSNFLPYLSTNFRDLLEALRVSQ